MKPLFIALEGIDGSGKSTQTKILSEKLTQLGHKVYQTFEPTDSDIGKMIREIFAGKREGDQKVIAALFAADRLNHILHSEKGLLRMRNDEYTIITDRYYLSSYAYHGAHVDMDWVIDMNVQAKMLLKPDIHIYIDVDPNVSMKRINASRLSKEMYETLDILQAVYEKYEEAIIKLGKSETIKRVNGNRQENEIGDDIWKEIKKIM